MDLLVDSDLQNRPTFGRMASIIRCFHKGVTFRISDLGAPHGPAFVVVRIDRHMLFMPGRAYVRDGVRTIDVNPNHPGFGDTTLAHEFGHHKNGDLYVDMWYFPFYIFQNMVFDWHIDIPMQFDLCIGRCRSI